MQLTCLVQNLKGTLTLTKWKMETHILTQLNQAWGVINKIVVKIFVFWSLDLDEHVSAKYRDLVTAVDEFRRDSMQIYFMLGWIVFQSPLTVLFWDSVLLPWHRNLLSEMCQGMAFRCYSRKLQACQKLVS